MEESSRRRGGLVVTICAASGTGGSIIAPQVAEALGVPLLDRAAPEEVRDAVEEAAALAPSTILDDDPELRQEVNTFLGMLGANTSYHLISPERAREVHAAIRRCLEAPLWELVNTGGGVVLGRSAEAALSSLVPALHVRLDGEWEERIALNMQLEEAGREETWRHVLEADRARNETTRRLYQVDPTDLRRYHLVLDVPRIGTDAAVVTIVAAARALESQLGNRAAQEQEQEQDAHVPA